MFFYRRVNLFLLVLCACSAAGAAEHGTFTVGTIQAAPGEAVSGYLEIAPVDNAGSRIPVSVIQGAKPGPVLALIAGTHGYEYAGITALRQLRQSVRPAGLSGTLVLVHIANPPSFYARSIYTSPVDGQNLNRVYPGKPDGTLSERIADSITRNVIEQADYLVDLHAGDGNEALRPYVYMPVTGKPELDKASRGMALAFGLDHIVIDEGRVQPADASVYTDQTALSRGIPAITTETGQLGSDEPYWVNLAVQGCENLMRHLGMIEGEVRPNEAVVWLSGYEVIRSPATGIFRAAVRDGYAVAENGLLGTLFDPFGEKIAELRAPFAGVVNYVVTTPPMNKGEPVAMISRIAEEGR
ncbi:MAG TPA: M14 family metallopeptidase [Xanthomonadales bacterium]|nr:M14 family metallopeptidase [Xanthomonadales bacterium]